MTQLDCYNWFCANRDSIISNHLGQSVVIRNNEILNYYKNDSEALKAMINEPKGSFIIQRCLPAEQTDLYYYTGRFTF